MHVHVLLSRGLVTCVRIYSGLQHQVHVIIICICLAREQIINIPSNHKLFPSISSPAVNLNL